MKTTLFIEISEITARIMVYNEVDQLCHYVDTTGGYGKKSIPLDIHYLKEGDILIGEDAITYEEEEGSNYIESILHAQDEVVLDYILVLINKVEDLIPGLTILNIVIVSDQLKFGSKTFKHMAKAKKKDLEISQLSIDDAIAGWIYGKEKTLDHQKKLLVSYFDYKKLISFRVNILPDTHLIELTKYSIQFDLNAIHDFYMHALMKSHNIEDHKISHHQMKQLYSHQKATLHKQLMLDKDVNVYSSLFFPPRKIVLTYETYKTFQDHWYEQLISENGISQWDVLKTVDQHFISGGYDLIQFCHNFDDLEWLSQDFDEYLLLDGGYRFYETMLKGKEIRFKQSLDYSIGVFNEKEFYPIVEETDQFFEHYEVELLLTDYQEDIQLFSKVKEKIIPIYNIPMKEPKKIQRILLKIDLNQDKEIEEVLYELRRL